MLLKAVQWVLGHGICSTSGFHTSLLPIVCQSTSLGLVKRYNLSIGHNTSFPPIFFPLFSRRRFASPLCFHIMLLSHPPALRSISEVVVASLTCVYCVQGRRRERAVERAAVQAAGYSAAARVPGRLRQSAAARGAQTTMPSACARCAALCRRDCKAALHPML